MGEDVNEFNFEIKKRNASIQLFLVVLQLVLSSLSAAETEGESITVVLATKPVLFAHDVNLVCTIQTAETPGHMAWIKIPNGETLALNNKTSNNTKYNIDMKYESSKMYYTLTIRKFAQSDVNVLYRCDSGFLSQYENLQLNKEDFIVQMQDTWRISLLILGPVLSSVIVMLVVCLLRRRRRKRLKQLIDTKKDQFNLTTPNTEQRDDELSTGESNTLESSNFETDILNKKRSANILEIPQVMTSTDGRRSTSHSNVEWDEPHELLLTVKDKEDTNFELQ